MTEPIRESPGDSAYGLVAEFEDAETLLRAAEVLGRSGYRRWEAHTPYPVHGIDGAMGLRGSQVPIYVLGLALAGAGLGFALQWWTSAAAYPLLVSGKPFFSWPAFVPITFECAILGGALGAVLGFLMESKLPRHHHPLFRHRAFERVTDDRFFLAVGADDPRFSDETEPLLTSLGGRVEAVAP